jgi:hypothetical protein
MDVIQADGRLGQDSEFKVSLDYRVRACLKKRKREKERCKINSKNH